MQKALSLRPPGLVPLGKGLLGDSPAGEQSKVFSYGTKLKKSVYANKMTLRSSVIFISFSLSHFCDNGISGIMVYVVCSLFCVIYFLF